MVEDLIEATEVLKFDNDELKINPDSPWVTMLHGKDINYRIENPVGIQSKSLSSAGNEGLMPPLPHLIAVNEVLGVVWFRDAMRFRDA